MRGWGSRSGIGTEGGGERVGIEMWWQGEGGGEGVGIEKWWQGDGD